jgi:DegV family protein with EDD domain
MYRVIILTDSVACLPGHFQEQLNIQIVPLSLYAGGKIYHDGLDISPTAAYELFLKDPESFKAAPATPDEFLRVLRRAAQYSDNILYVTVSLKISTMFNVAGLVKERARHELPGVNIELLDSNTATAAQGFVVLAAARCAAAGKALSEVVEEAIRVKNRVNAVVMLDTMKYVYRSGRVPKIAAQAASMLNIRPIFAVEGSVHFLTATRNKKTGIQRLKDLMRGKIADRPVHCSVMHAYDIEAAEKLKEQIGNEFACTELWISEFSPVMGYATGTGTIGLAFYTDE